MKLELTQEELNIVAGALGAQPFNVVAGLINKIAKQVEEQQKQPDLKVVPAQE